MTPIQWIMASVGVLFGLVIVAMRAGRLGWKAASFPLDAAAIVCYS